MLSVWLPARLSCTVLVPAEKIDAVPEKAVALEITSVLVFPFTVPAVPNATVPVGVMVLPVPRSNVPAPDLVSPAQFTSPDRVRVPAVFEQVKRPVVLNPPKFWVAAVPETVTALVPRLILVFTLLLYRLPDDKVNVIDEEQVIVPVASLVRVPVVNISLPVLVKLIEPLLVQVPALTLILPVETVKLPLLVKEVLALPRAMIPLVPEMVPLLVSVVPLSVQVLVAMFQVPPELTVMMGTVQV